MLSLTLRAEELLPTVQRELRVRKFYFGEINGRATEETVAAIRKFQEARGIDKSGNIDADTLRALNLPTTSAESDEARILGECCNFVHRYFQARESGDWELEGPFFAASVNYYEDEVVDLAFIRKAREKYNLQWPNRKITLLQRIATLVEGGTNAVQVTARVRFEVSSAKERPRVKIENLLFRLERNGAEWRIAAVKEL